LAPHSAPDQGPVADCHDFAAVALVEAGYYRYHCPDPANPYNSGNCSKRLDLAPQDLFVCCTRECPVAAYKAVDGSMQCRLEEAGSPNLDVAYLVRNGVLPTDACRPYREFSKSLHTKAQELQAKAQEELGKIMRQGPASDDLTVPGVKLTQAEEKQMEGPALDADQQRREIKQQLKGFHYDTESFDYLPWEDLQKISPQDCDKEGRPQFEIINRELRAKRPVILAMSLRGLAAWKMKSAPGPKDPPGDTAGHAFLVVGRDSKEGLTVFKTYNSWGGLNPDVSEQDLCRVMSITMVYAPNEAE
jgi:hypothetical protein